MSVNADADLEQAARIGRKPRRTVKFFAIMALSKFVNGGRSFDIGIFLRGNCHAAVGEMLCGVASDRACRSRITAGQEDRTGRGRCNLFRWRAGAKETFIKRIGVQK